MVCPVQGGMNVYSECLLTPLKKKKKHTKQTFQSFYYHHREQDAGVTVALVTKMGPNS